MSHWKSIGLRIYLLSNVLIVCIGCKREPASLGRAHEYMRDGRYSEAIVIVREVLEDSPENEEALASLCGCECALGDFASALTTCKQSLRALPDDPPTLLNLGMALFHTGQIADGMTKGHKAMEIDRNLDRLVRETASTPGATTLFYGPTIEYFRELASEQLGPTIFRRYQSPKFGLAIDMPEHWAELTPLGIDENSVAIGAEDEEVVVLITRSRGYSPSERYPNLPRLLVSKQFIEGEASLRQQPLLELESIIVVGQPWYSGVRESRMGDRPMRSLYVTFWTGDDSYTVTATTPARIFETRADLLRRMIESIEVTP